MLHEEVAELGVADAWLCKAANHKLRRRREELGCVVEGEVSSGLRALRGRLAHIHLAARPLVLHHLFRSLAPNFADEERDFDDGELRKRPPHAVPGEEDVAERWVVLREKLRLDLFEHLFTNVVPGFEEALVHLRPRLDLIEKGRKDELEIGANILWAAHDRSAKGDGEYVVRAAGGRPARQGAERVGLCGEHHRRRAEAEREVDVTVANLRLF
mmetsp:Transcript_28767/g.93991  ORF Transcript_28767/g.93991 Transcript_28767/m.93991 type:complete len:214 (+) Transcript_28767:1148-1789(+)